MAFSLKRTLGKVSLGLVIALIWLFFWIRADILFPTNTEVWRLNYILTLMGLVTFTFAWDTITNKTERGLFTASFIKAFPKFIISALITLTILFVTTLIISPTSMNTVQMAIASVSLGVLLTHAFLVAVGEELVFRGWIPEQLKARGFTSSQMMWISTIIFALFHAGMGKSIITLFTYIPLGLLFYTIKGRYSPKSNMANAGVHFAWNLFILGFLNL